MGYFIAKKASNTKLVNSVPYGIFTILELWVAQSPNNGFYYLAAFLTSMAGIITYLHFPARSIDWKKYAEKYKEVLIFLLFLLGATYFIASEAVDTMHNWHECRNGDHQVFYCIMKTFSGNYW